MSIKKICTQCGAEYGPEQKFCPNDGSPLRAESSDDPLIGRIIADRYHVTSLIGEGGMGRVYVAEHVRMGRKSALKVMSPALAATADAITRFNREAANASRINHPNVAAIYDFGETPDGLLYLAMEFVEGESLHALVQRDGPLPIARAAQITKGATDALSAAHHLGIIHRDLKPDNIMLARQLDGSDWVKVVDFGIAKSVATPGEGGGQTVTTAGVSLGTPEYMSPEQLAGEKFDQRTDIYSLGLVLFNMLTGDLPYPKLTSKETLVRRLTSRPASLTAVRPGIAWPAPLQVALDRRARSGARPALRQRRRFWARGGRSGGWHAPRRSRADGARGRARSADPGTRRYAGQAVASFGQARRSGSHPRPARQPAQAGVARPLDCGSCGARARRWLYRAECVAAPHPRVHRRHGARHRGFGERRCGHRKPASEHGSGTAGGEDHHTAGHAPGGAPRRAATAGGRGHYVAPTGCGPRHAPCRSG